MLVFLAYMLTTSRSKKIVNEFIMMANNKSEEETVTGEVSNPTLFHAASCPLNFEISAKKKLSDFSTAIAVRTRSVKC